MYKARLRQENGHKHGWKSWSGHENVSYLRRSLRYADGFAAVLLRTSKFGARPCILPLTLDIRTRSRTFQLSEAVAAIRRWICSCYLPHLESDAWPYMKLKIMNKKRIHLLTSRSVQVVGGRRREPETRQRNLGKRIKEKWKNTKQRRAKRKREHR